MNILTFDIEEWYVEKTYLWDRTYKYKLFDETLAKVLDELDKVGIKATFFCVGQMAVEFPKVVRQITERGHEVGCHSNKHIWLNKMGENDLRLDTIEALKALEDVAGYKIESYRAPAFSLTPNNKWAINVLADCGIKRDASIFPTSRDLGGYKYFPKDTPCVISHEGASLKEFPICVSSIMGRQLAYSGGGYFRMMPYWLVSKIVKARDYNICYFHLADLIVTKKKMLSNAEYEKYFKEKGTLKKRFFRYIKNTWRFGDTFEKMDKLLNSYQFVNIKEAEPLVDWEKSSNVSL